MSNYIVYKNEHGTYVVELLNESYDEFYEVEKDLINQGFIISEIKGGFIKCFKVKDYEK